MADEAKGMLVLEHDLGLLGWGITVGAFGELGGGCREWPEVARFAEMKCRAGQPLHGRPKDDVPRGHLCTSAILGLIHGFVRVVEVVDWNAHCNGW
jgi:hypothetical protein